MAVASMSQPVELPRWLDLVAAAAAQPGARAGRRRRRGGRSSARTRAGADAAGQGRLRLGARHQLHAVLRHHLRLHRAGGGGGLPRRPVQHRRRGPGHHGRPGRRPGGAGARPHAAGLADAAADGAGGDALFGMAWAAVPGALQAWRGSHVVITTIMFNFIASALLVYLLVERAEGARQHDAGEPRLRRRGAAAGHAHAAGLGWASSGRARR